MKKFVLGMLAACALMGALGLTLTGVGGSLTPEYLWAAKSIFVGNDPQLNDNTLIAVNGRYTGASAAGTYKEVIETHVKNIIPAATNNTSQNAMVSAYGNWTGEGGTLTNYTDFLASYWEAEGTGTLSNVAGLTIWFDGLHSTPLAPANIWGIRTIGNDQAGGNIPTLKNNLAGRTIIGVDTTSVTNAPLPSMVFEPVTFANLTAAPNGTMTYCSDCNPANCTAGASTGSFCKRQNGAWLPM